MQAVRAGEPFVFATREKRPEQTDLLNAAIAALGPGFHLLRLGNPLSSPLTLGRILIQLGSSDQEAADGNEVRSVLDALKARRSSDDQVVIAVEEAETLEPEALSFLGALPSAAVGGLPRPQLLLVGGPGLLALVEQQRSQGFPEQAGGDLRRTDAPLVRALRRAKGTDRFVAAAGTASMDMLFPMGGAVAIGPALPAAALDDATAPTVAPTPLANHPAPSTTEEGSEDGRLRSDVPSGVLERVDTARAGHRMAGMLVLLALLLGAVLAGFLSGGSLPHWAFPWER